MREPSFNFMGIFCFKKGEKKEKEGKNVEDGRNFEEEGERHTGAGEEEKGWFFAREDKVKGDDGGADHENF